MYSQVVYFHRLYQVLHKKYIILLPAQFLEFFSSCRVWLAKQYWSDYWLVSEFVGCDASPTRVKIIFADNVGVIGADSRYKRQPWARSHVHACVVMYLCHSSQPQLQVHAWMCLEHFGECVAPTYDFAIPVTIVFRTHLLFRVEIHRLLLWPYHIWNPKLNSSRATNTTNYNSTTC